MITLLAAAAALVPANPVPAVTQALMARARDRYFLGVLAVGAVWLAWIGEWWLAGMALWFLIRWRSADVQKHIVTWVAIGATWGLLRQIPAPMLEWVPYGWMAVACWHVGLSLYLARHHGDPYKRKKISPRSRGALGSPVITAMFFALVAPFAPWWFWPVLAVGFYMTFSGLAVFAVLVEFAVLYPWTIPYSLAFCALVGITLWKSPRIKGERMWEWTPRGDSLDSITSRLWAWRYLIQGWWEVCCAGHDYPGNPWKCGRWLGHGPGRAEYMVKTIGSVRHQDLPSGECHAEAAQHLYEYGVLGLVAALALVIRCGLSLEPGDPWSAALVGAGVLTLFHWPLRHPTLGVMFLTICAGVLAR